MSRTRPQPAKALIVARGERIKDVAAAIGLGEQSLYAVLSGRSTPWPALTEKLAAKLDVDPTVLWHDDQSLADTARRIVERTRREQDLPDTLTDEAVLSHLADIVATFKEVA